MVVVLYITMKEYQVLAVLGLLYSISQRTVFWLLYSISHCQSIESIECVQFFGCCTIYQTDSFEWVKFLGCYTLYHKEYRVYTFFWHLYDTSCKQSIECPRLLIAAPYITLTEWPTFSCCTLHHTDRVAYRFLLHPTSHNRVTYRFLLGMIPIPSSSPSGVT